MLPRLVKGYGPTARSPLMIPSYSEMDPMTMLRNSNAMKYLMVPGRSEHLGWLATEWRGLGNTDPSLRHLLFT
jgi:hypothetical protein